MVMRSSRVACLTAALVSLSLLFSAPLRAAEQGIGMVTGSATGTYIRFGQDIAKLAASEGLQILVKESEGSLDNIKRLSSTENAALGIVQSDVLGFLKTSQDPKTREIARQLRMIVPFYNEEVHVFARKDIQRFQDLAGKRVVVGTQGSGNWLTSTFLLGLLGVQPATRLELAPPAGVGAVLAGQADAMVYVAGKPVRLFTKIMDLTRDPRHADLVRDVHFIPLSDARMLQYYVPSTIGTSDYEWVGEASIPTVAVKAVLVSFDFSSRSTPYFKTRCEELARLGRVVRANIEELRRSGHPKWKEVNLDMELGIWQRDSCSRSAPPQMDLVKELERILTKP